MENEILINTPVQFLGSVCGMEITPYKGRIMSETNKIVLKDELVEILKKSLGTNIFALSISPENLLRYKDGTYSSMIKQMDGTGIKKHIGFETINYIKAADEIYSKLVSNIGLSFIPDICNEVMNSYNALQSGLYSINSTLMIIQENQDFLYENQLNEHYANINSFNVFFNEVKKNIFRIMNNPESRKAYLSKVLDIKQQIYKEYDFFKLSINSVIQNSFGGKNIQKHTANFCVVLDYLLDLLVNNLELEYILGGDYTINQSYISEEVLIVEKEIKQLVSELSGRLNTVYSGWFDCSNGPQIKNIVNNYVNIIIHKTRKISNMQKKLLPILKSSIIVPEHFIPNTTFEIQENVTKDEIKKARKLLKQETKEIVIGNDEEDDSGW